MKRFALVFGALMLWIPVTGCDSGGSSTPPDAAASKIPVPHPHAKGEVKEAEEKAAKRQAERAAQLKKTSKHANPRSR